VDDAAGSVQLMLPTAESEPAADGQPDKGSFASGARILSIGIASTGLFTFAYLATASHVLGKGSAYSRISICWAIMYVILSVIYRPIEQLLSRTIADRHARGLHGHILRTPALIQGSLASLFLIVALALHGEIANRLLDGSNGLYWILMVGVLAYAASYFARGWLARNRRFALYRGNRSVVGAGGKGCCFFAANLQAWNAPRRRRSMTRGVRHVCSSCSISLLGCGRWRSG
jgi:hypothetical protein